MKNTVIHFSERRVMMPFRKSFLSEFKPFVLTGLMMLAACARSENNPWIGQCISPWPSPIENIDAVEDRLGRDFEIIEHWVYWTQPFSELADECDAIYSNGSILELCWQPHDGQNTLTNAQILSGSWDNYIRKYAGEIQEWGEPIWIRLMHEMNGDWYGWSVGIKGNTNESFIDAWKHVVDIFREEGAENVKWVYSVNWQSKPGASFMGAYPGDDYVDFLSIDGYNWGTTESWSHWQSFDETFRPAYNALKVNSRPINISEWGCVEKGGDKAAWITAAFNLVRHSGTYDLIQALIWFDLESGSSDFRINTSPAALAAYKAAINYTSTRVASNVAQKVAGFELLQNYPNPFNAETTIQFHLAKTSRVRLLVYDANGRLVRSLMDMFFPAGSHTVKWDGRNEQLQPATSGLYAIRMQADAFVQNRKMVLLR